MSTRINDTTDLQAISRKRDLRRKTIPALAQASGLSEEELSQIVADNTTGKLLGVFGEETVNVLGVNLDIAKAMGLVSQTTK